MRRIFEITLLDRAFPFSPNVAAAVDRGGADSLQALQEAQLGAAAALAGATCSSSTTARMMASPMPSSGSSSGSGSACDAREAGPLVLDLDADLALVRSEPQRDTALVLVGMPRGVRARFRDGKLEICQHLRVELDRVGQPREREPGQHQVLAFAGMRRTTWIRSPRSCAPPFDAAHLQPAAHRLERAPEA